VVVNTEAFLLAIHSQVGLIDLFSGSAGLWPAIVWAKLATPGYLPAYIAGQCQVPAFGQSYLLVG